MGSGGMGATKRGSQPVWGDGCHLSAGTSPGGSGPLRLTPLGSGLLLSWLGSRRGAQGQWGQAAGDRAAPLCLHQTSRIMCMRERPSPPPAALSTPSPSAEHSPGPLRRAGGQDKTLRPPRPLPSPVQLGLGSPPAPAAPDSLSFGLGSEAWRAGGHTVGGDEAQRQLGRRRKDLTEGGWGPGGLGHLII